MSEFQPKTPLETIKTIAAEFPRRFPSMAMKYFRNLFPIATWIFRYNLEWFWGDLIAGVTVGMVVIPQAIAYSTKLANLPAEFGLYTSFTGVLLYSIFATSRDVTIGPTSVLSLLVGQTVASYGVGDSTADRIKFAVSLSFVAGIIQVGIGLFGLGLAFEFVSLPVISGFTAGAAIQIIIGQLPTLTGIKGINTNDPSYLVLVNIFNSLNKLPDSKIDSVFGISALVFILIIKYSCLFLSKKYFVLKYVGYLRNGITLFIFTLISYTNRNNINYSIVKNVPFGLSGITQPSFDSNFMSAVFRAVPGILVVSILEHLAVVKSYGRLNGYTPDGNQEILAIGLSNVVGSFFGSYPSTGSFSRSAIKSSSGVRTPLASFITGFIVVLSLFSITSAFYYIPNSVLAAIVIAAIVELFSNFKVVKSLLEVELSDFFGFWIALIATFFSSIETAIYISVAFSLVVLLSRIARPSIRVLSRSSNGSWMEPGSESYSGFKSDIIPTPEGILVFRPQESLTYPNSTFLLNQLKNEVMTRFNYTGPSIPNSELIWNDNRQEKRKIPDLEGRARLPPLKAVIFDFIAVNHIDYTGLQTLLDAKEYFERFAGRIIPFHFVHVKKAQLNILWRVSGKEADTIDALSVLSTQSNPIFSSVLKFKQPNWFTKHSVTANSNVKDGGKYFHLSIDGAIEAAVKETHEMYGQLSVSSVVTVPEEACDISLQVNGSSDALLR